MSLVSQNLDGIRKTYDEDGFVVVEDLLTKQEIEVLTRRLEGIASGQLTHVPEQNLELEPDVIKGKVTPATRMDALRKLTDLCRYDDIFLSYAKKKRTMDVIEAILGPDIKIFGDQLFVKPPFYGIEKPYHQDSAYFPIQPMALVTCWLALDPATLENGCLHFIRESHKLGLIDHNEKWMVGDREDKQVSGSKIDYSMEVAAPLKTGSASLHHSLTLHKSGPNTSSHRRRGWAVVYMGAKSHYTGNIAKKPKYELVRGVETTGRV